MKKKKNKKPKSIQDTLLQVYVSNMHVAESEDLCNALYECQSDLIHEFYSINHVPPKKLQSVRHLEILQSFLVCLLLIALVSILLLIFLELRQFWG